MHAPALISDNNYEPTTTHASFEEKGKCIEEKYNIHAIASIIDLLYSDIDYVSICTPSGTHLEFVLKPPDFSGVNNVFKIKRTVANISIRIMGMINPDLR